MAARRPWLGALLLLFLTGAAVQGRRGGRGRNRSGQDQDPQDCRLTELLMSMKGELMRLGSEVHDLRLQLDQKCQKDDQEKDFQQDRQLDEDEETQDCDRAMLFGKDRNGTANHRLSPEQPVRIKMTEFGDQSIIAQFRKINNIEPSFFIEIEEGRSEWFVILRTKNGTDWGSRRTVIEELPKNTQITLSFALRENKVFVNLKIDGGQTLNYNLEPQDGHIISAQGVVYTIAKHEEKAGFSVAWNCPKDCKRIELFGMGKNAMANHNLQPDEPVRLTLTEDMLHTIIARFRKVSDVNHIFSVELQEYETDQWNLVLRTPKGVSTESISSPLPRDKIISLSFEVNEKQVTVNLEVKWEGSYSYTIKEPNGYDIPQQGLVYSIAKDDETAGFSIVWNCPEDCSRVTLYGSGKNAMAKQQLQPDQSVRFKLTEKAEHTIIAKFSKVRDMSSAFTIEIEEAKPWRINFKTENGTNTVNMTSPLTRNKWIYPKFYVTEKEVTLLLETEDENPQTYTVMALEDDTIPTQGLVYAIAKHAEKSGFNVVWNCPDDCWRDTLYGSGKNAMANQKLQPDQPVRLKFTEDEDHVIIAKFRYVNDLTEAFSLELREKDTWKMVLRTENGTTEVDMENSPPKNIWLTMNFLVTEEEVITTWEVEGGDYYNYTIPVANGTMLPTKGLVYSIAKHEEKAGFYVSWNCPEDCKRTTLFGTGQFAIANHRLQPDEPMRIRLTEEKDNRIILQFFEEDESNSTFSLQLDQGNPWMLTLSTENGNNSVEFTDYPPRDKWLTMTFDLEPEQIWMNMDVEGGETWNYKITAKEGDTIPVDGVRYRVTKHTDKSDFTVMWGCPEDCQRSTVFGKGVTAKAKHRLQQDQPVRVKLTEEEQHVIIAQFKTENDNNPAFSVEMEEGEPWKLVVRTENGETKADLTPAPPKNSWFILNFKFNETQVIMSLEVEFNATYNYTVVLNDGDEIPTDGLVYTMAKHDDKAGYSLIWNCPDVPVRYTKDGETCVFPFIDKDRNNMVMRDCATGNIGLQWCATSLNPDGTHDTWGYCEDPDAPPPTEAPITTSTPEGPDDYYYTSTPDPSQPGGPGQQPGGPGQQPGGPGQQPGGPGQQPGGPGQKPGGPGQKPGKPDQPWQRTTTTPEPTTTEPPPPVECRQPYREVGKGCYLMFHDPRDWKSFGQANAICQNYGGILASPRRLGDLQDHLQLYYSDAFWIGGRYDADRRRWHWPDGRTISSSGWVSGAPQKAKTKRCVYLDARYNYKINNYYCGEKYPFICSPSY
ncbi:unnamed protein product [Meganyctiphanes norvegica]|uniref:C-type lectin domain-containing protein n=1 Tax=Meganyctiphanes norvegica TaxID=48144 RepID=A0AAV2PPX5_MEGNR